ncbi:MAG TPA: type II toxin-antitoxin system PemK/MazF family toxin [bacterium]|nr:type II toxin-antitoxin system PemK/MazF family toxin [bacterium]
MRNKFRYGCIYLVNFDPSVGHEFAGVRPAVIVQADSIILKSNLLTVIPLTLNQKNKLPDDILISADAKNRLREDSVIKVYNIVSLDQNRFIKMIGMVDEKVLLAIRKYLSQHFNLE